MTTASSRNAAERPPRSFMVEVAAELLSDLDEWSRPLQVRVEVDASERGSYRMTFREPQRPTETQGNP